MNTDRSEATRHQRLLLIAFFLTLLLAGSTLAQGGALNRAVIEDDVVAAGKLLQQGANPDEKDADGDTPLLNALEPMLLEPKPQPPEVVDDEVKKEKRVRLEMVRLLLAHGADVNLRGSHDTTALMLVANWGFGSAHDIKLLTLLLERKADINLQDDRGFTALMWATFRNKPEVVKFLLAHRADSKLKNHEGATALSIAQSSNSIKLVRLLQRAKN
jgi:ankyrin repeat protein